MTHYVHTGTVRDRAARQASRYNREKAAVLWCWHTYVNSFGRRQYLPDVMDYLPIRSITVCGKSDCFISADGTFKIRQWRDVTGLPMCNGLDVISSGDVSTGTGFCSVPKPDLHSAMLVEKRTNKPCWDCYVLERYRFGGGSFVVCGGKMSDQKTYFVVMQDKFNALYRRCLVTACHTSSSSFLTHKKKWSGNWNRLKQKKKTIECNVFFSAKFPERCGYFELKRNKCDVPVMPMMYLG